MSAEENLKKNNIILPKAADPVGAYVATKKAGNFLCIVLECIGVHNNFNILYLYIATSTNIFASKIFYSIIIP